MDEERESGLRALGSGLAWMGFWLAVGAGCVASEIPEEDGYWAYRTAMLECASED